MPTAAIGEIEICYETHGSPVNPPILLISGLGSQLLSQPPEYCQLYVDEGFFVIRFDNRDVGLSTKVASTAEIGTAIRALSAGQPVSAPYRLTDMAADTVGLLDHLGLDSVHAVGVSMGGMIAQTMAIEDPMRLRSLVSIMSTTGDLDVGQATTEARELLLSPRPPGRDEYIAREIEANRVIGSPGYHDPERIAAAAAAAYDRGVDPEGVARQLIAVWASGSRSAALTSIDIPTLVIHGRADPLVNVDGGERTAKMIPGAELLVIDELGHDRPPALWPSIVEPVSGFVRDVEERRAAS